MMEQIQSRKDGVIAFQVSDKVTLDQYLACENIWTDEIAKKGSVKAILILEELKLPEMGVFFEDMKQGIKHCKDFKAFAVVGHHKWEKIWTKIFGTIIHINVKYFDESQTDEAWEWIADE